MLFDSGIRNHLVHDPLRCMGLELLNGKEWPLPHGHSGGSGCGNPYEHAPVRRTIVPCMPPGRDHLVMHLGRFFYITKFMLPSNSNKTSSPAILSRPRNRIPRINHRATNRHLGRRISTGYIKSPCCICDSTREYILLNISPTAK